MRPPFRPRQVRPLAIRDHWPDAIRNALFAAVKRRGVYPPLILPMLENGLITAREAEGGEYTPTRKGLACLPRRADQTSALKALTDAKQTSHAEAAK